MIIFLLKTHKLVVLLLRHFDGKDELGKIFEGFAHVKRVALETASHLSFFSFKLGNT